ncbi:hypothetical protein AMK16_27255 [Streptomyces sp. CB00455]|uniref:DUF2382 domain-containing protein n=1 Tax=Streptomyces sp. CB00455 TaxID=1703927 RepID=UPI00093F1708|nr:hypothetical protein AMK16_27255 [Streptomyces sp. CB00455]
MSGPDTTEAEHEVTRHEERIVVETEAVPVEGVRLNTEEPADEETVTGKVAKDKIAADTPDDDMRDR